MNFGNKLMNKLRFYIMISDLKSLKIKFKDQLQKYVSLTTDIFESFYVPIQMLIISKLNLYQYLEFEEKSNYISMKILL